MLTYLSGDLFEHLQGRDVIAHCCNDIGRFGGGFSGALCRFFDKAFRDYLEWSNTKEADADPPFRLGETRLCPCSWKTLIASGKRKDEYRVSTCYVAHMIGQHGVISRRNPHPIDYDALKRAMKNVIVQYSTRVSDQPISRIVAPKFGADLAGGDWNKIEKLINDVWKDVNVVIFEL